MINNQEEQLDNSIFTHFVGISFDNNSRSYFFGLKDLELKIGDKVVVETARGLELGEVSIETKEMSEYSSSLGLRPVLRLADKVDIKMHEANIEDAKKAILICRQEIESLKLNMNLISCEYTLDKTKVLFTYLADERVDFRELLKTLAAKLHTRIELRQIGTRDKAKSVGGLGMCGLPICCSTFLHEFDGISINRAKNQMLAINIPKLSGHCGKLLCCLKFEDDAYTDLKKDFPDIGTKVFIDKVQYAVTGLNVISKVVKIENEEDVKFLDFDMFKEQTHWRKHKENEEK